MMFDIVLVDDEIASIKFMRQLIKSFVPGFQIVGEFENGYDALEFLKTRQVDLLITDVKMPIMDGVTLAKEVRCLYPDIHMIIVSGYAEFGYAKAAIEAAVEEYLLKPLNITHTQTVLAAVEKKLIDKQTDVKNEAVRSLFTAANANLKSIRKQIGPSPFYLATIRFGNLQSQRVHGEFYQLGVSQSAALKNVWVLQGREHAEWFVMSEMKIKDIGQLLGLVKPRTNLSTYTCIIYQKPVALSNVRERAEEMSHYLDDKLVIGRSAVYDVPPYVRHQYENFPKSELRKLDSAITSGNNRLIKETLLTWAVHWEKNALPQRWVERAIDQIVQRALEFVKQPDVDHLRIFKEIAELYLYVNSTGDLMLGVWDIVFEPLVNTKSGRQESSKVYDQIIGYVDENYAEALTIQNTCSIFGISQTYLSRLLRKYGETTFTEYLTNCRIENAKRLICENPEIKVIDVASLVGYDDASYFGKVFRLRENMTPSQYAMQAIKP